MLYRDTQELLSLYLESLQVQMKPLSNGQYQMADVQRFKAAAAALSEVAVLETVLSSLDAIPLLRDNSSDTFIMDANMMQQISQISASAYLKGEVIRSFLNETISPRPERSFIAKFPDGNLGSAEESIHVLKEILDQVLIGDDVQGSYEVINYYSGSFGIEVVVPSALGMALIGGIVWAAAVARKKWLEGTLLREQIRAYSLHNDVIEEMSKKLKDEVDMIVDHEARALAARNFDSPKGEYTMRLRHCIHQMLELLLKGTEVRQALYPPEEVKNLFPDFRRLDSITSQIKQIADTTEDA